MIDYTYKDLFFDFRKYFKPYIYKLTGGTFLRFLSAIVHLYNALAFAQIVTFITNYRSGDSLAYLYVILISWTVASVIRHLLVYYAKIICIPVGEQIALDIEKDTIKHLSSLDMSWHEKENSGNKVQRILKGANGVSTLVRVWIINIIDICVNFVGVFFIISRFNFNLALLVILNQIIYFSIATVFKGKTAKASRKVNVKNEEHIGLMFEIANNIRSVKVLGIVTPLLDFVKNNSSELMGLLKKKLFWQHFGMFNRMSWQSIGRNILISIVVYGVIKGYYELSFLVLFYGYVNTLNTSTDDLANVTQDVLLAKTDIERLAGLIHQKIMIDNEEGKIDFPQDWDGIHIKNLSFGYGNSNVLNNISFHVKKGEKVGIVGLSGAGKSTLFKLLLKEHEVIDENIYIGNTPLIKIKKSDYTKHVAVVLQDTEVFNLSLRRNIIISNNKDQESEEAFQKAITISHVTDFVHKLPCGIETLIGEKGVKLSGGEKQRLGIARAVFKNPEILFLDEATSHLDVESEQKIQDSLKHFFKDVTAVVIAHRLSTIKEMDRIIVMEKGEIVETGSFNELIEKEGRFKEFWDKQNRSSVL